MVRRKKKELVGCVTTTKTTALNGDWTASDQF